MEEPNEQHEFQVILVALQRPLQQFVGLTVLYKVFPDGRGLLAAFLTPH